MSEGYTKSNMDRKVNNRVRGAVTVLLITIVNVIVCVSLYLDTKGRTERMERLITEQQYTIQRLAFGDSLARKYLHTELTSDSNTLYLFRVKNGESLTYQQIDSMERYNRMKVEALERFLRKSGVSVRYTISDSLLTTEFTSSTLIPRNGDD